jgi:hypothetical protein
MSDKTSAPQEAARRDRLGAALRENLKRRKAQARARATGQGTDERTGEPPAGRDAEADNDTGGDAA